MITASPTQVDTRESLLELARLQMKGELDQASDAFLADTIRAFAPALRGERDNTEVFSWMEELCAAITLVDGCEDGSLHWCEVLGGASGNDLDGQALDAARDKLTLTLDKLTAVTS